ncbi:FMN-linked oxidoreductase [Patellaria atrata CBS 101060]|uniref:FMN-linked oxidoreductase n=1 Tax=Patellaria atrata CBS 101060 TaxID=1346257 RepID=A0A9P4S7U3_9PEZI|nr:FMN-linked oxidoreductase [Patellaria atrata CBS 101060]
MAPQKDEHPHHALECDTQPDNQLINRAAPGVSFFTPYQEMPAGKAFEPGKDDKQIPKLFQPLKIRGMTMQNRIMLSPLCQYSAEDGHHTSWHFAHLGGILQRGPGLTMVEATAVQARGRITPEDSGLWKDSQKAPLKRIVEFAHSQNQNIGIQLGHAGRKASTVAPWLSSGDVAGVELNGWPDDVVAPSAVPYNDKHAQPRAMSADEISEFKTAFNDAVKRALDIGFDVIEIHAAHGYLLHSFLSPATNKRQDQYGGSFDNRVRLLCELIQETRSSVPDTYPLFLRISSTDWLEESELKNDSWTVAQSVELAQRVRDLGVDVLDCSSGGNHPLAHVHSRPGYQVPPARTIAKALASSPSEKTMFVASVGAITSGAQAEAILTGTGGGTGLDVVVVGRAFLKNPFLVWSWAEELGVEVNLPSQIRWGFGGRGPRKS